MARRPAAGPLPRWPRCSGFEEGDRSSSSSHRLAADDPHPETELDYTNPYTLLVAVALSAQMTDVGVNKATRAAVREVPTPAARWSRSARTRLREHIKTIGFNNTKAKNVIALSQALIDHYGGEVPRGPRRARNAARRRPQDRQCRAQLRFGHETFAVDTHIFRVCNRTGLARGKTRWRSN